MAIIEGIKYEGDNCGTAVMMRPGCANCGYVFARAGRSQVEQIELTKLLREERAQFNASIKIWNAALKEHNKDDGHPSDYALTRMMDKGCAAYLMMDSVAIRKNHKSIGELNLSKKACNESITMHSTFRDLKSYEMDFTGGIKSYKVSKTLNYESINSHNKSLGNSGLRARSWPTLFAQGEGRVDENGVL